MVRDRLRGLFGTPDEDMDEEPQVQTTPLSGYRTEREVPDSTTGAMHHNGKEHTVTRSYAVDERGWEFGELTLVEEDETTYALRNVDRETRIDDEWVEDRYTVALGEVHAVVDDVEEPYAEIISGTSRDAAETLNGELATRQYGPDQPRYFGEPETFDTDT